MTRTKGDLLRLLWELVRLTALDEGSPQAFRVRGYEKAIAGLESWPGDVLSLDKKELTEIPGVGAATADKVLEYGLSGSINKVETLREKYPPAFVELTKIPGLGPKTLKMLRSQLGVENLEDLKAALEGEQLRSLPGMGEKSEEKIAKAIERLGLHGKDRRTPLVEARSVARRLVEQLKTLASVDDAVFCGSMRRFVETIGDIDIVVSTDEPAAVSAAVVELPEVDQLIGSGDTKTSFLTREGLQVDVRTVTPDQLGSALLYFTGSKTHNIALRQIAIDQGFLLSEYGLFDGDRLIASKTEAEIYAALGLPEIPPPLREGGGELSLTSQDLSALVSRAAIKGDLHYHSDRSGDGRSSSEAMAKAAVDAEYEYIAFTDHGEDLAINGSSRSEMLQHRDRLRDLESKVDGLRILFGCELNIGPEGQLDYDPDFRREFDFCVASIHSHFDLPQDRQTARILTALADPSVTSIGHLSGRYVGRRPGVELDIDVILEALEVTGVALEINGALDRLDATTEVVRRAMDRDVVFAIDTDSHHVRDLKRMDYGVQYAQRAWVPADRVVNTWDTGRLVEWTTRRKNLA